MGKKSGRNAGDKATAFVLRVPMHCRCNGCADKIRAGVKDITLHHGIEALDQSALWTKGDLTVVSSADPEKLRRRLHKATGKNVDLLLLPPKDATKATDDRVDAAAMQELLRRTLQQGQYAQALPLPGWQQQHGGYAAQAYPWPVQVPQPEAYYPSYGHSAYPAAAPVGGAWGAYAYPPAAAQGHGAYGGGWHGAHGPY